MSLPARPSPSRAAPSRPTRLRPIGEPGLLPEEVAAFAIGEPVVDVRLRDRDLERVRVAKETLVAAADQGAVYGLTTGVGALRGVSVEFDEDAPDAHGRRLWRSHAAGVGPELSDEEARATMLVRLHQLLRGGAGVDPALVSALAEALATGAVPRLRGVGAVGTGDLTALAQLGLTLIGELPWRSGGVAPAPLTPGDALPFPSSNAVTVAVASLDWARLVRLLRSAEQVAALSHLALRGSLEAYDERVHAGKDDPDVASVAGRLRLLLARPDGSIAGVRVQDPFGLRALPQVHGAAEAALRDLHAVLTAEIGASAENPLVTSGRVLHHGQFMTQRLASALDAARAAIVPVLTLSQARLTALLDPHLTGLRAFLADGPPASSGLMITEYVAADLLTRARTFAATVTGGRTVLALGLEEHASHATWSAWLGRDLADLVPDLLAAELVAAVRALRFDPERATPGVPALALLDRCDWPDVRADHVLGPELEAAAALLRSL